MISWQNFNWFFKKISEVEKKSFRNLITWNTAKFYTFHNLDDELIKLLYHIPVLSFICVLFYFTLG